MQKTQIITTTAPGPVCFRLPKSPALDPHFGGSRSFWNGLVLPNAKNNFKPPVRSIVIAQPGAKRGIRFIVFDSAKAYFAALAQNAAQIGGQP
jgi:hypothetical protein